VFVLGWPSRIYVANPEQCSLLPGHAEGFGSAPFGETGPTLPQSYLPHHDTADDEGVLNHALEFDCIQSSLAQH
jgi:hypothetical protein